MHTSQSPVKLVGFTQPLSSLSHSASPLFHADRIFRRSLQLLEGDAAHPLLGSASALGWSVSEDAGGEWRRGRRPRRLRSAALQLPPLLELETGEGRRQRGCIGSERATAGCTSEEGGLASWRRSTKNNKRTDTATALEHKIRTKKKKEKISSPPSLLLSHAFAASAHLVSTLLPALLSVCLPSTASAAAAAAVPPPCRCRWPLAGRGVAAARPSAGWRAASATRSSTPTGRQGREEQEEGRGRVRPQALSLSAAGCCCLDC